jgi:hypothetical protein
MPGDDLGASSSTPTEHVVVDIAALQQGLDYALEKAAPAGNQTQEQRIASMDEEEAEFSDEVGSVVSFGDQ